MRIIDADKIMADIAASARSTSKDYSLLSIARYISIQPTIDAEPVRHGHWTRDYESSWGDSRFMCSVCHCKESVPTCNGEPFIWDYCPNCGARMNEVKNEIN